MPGKYYFLYVNADSGKNPNEEIEKIFANMEWARFRGGDFYLIYTDKPISEIRDNIKPLLGARDHFLLGEFNWQNHSGFLSSNTVEWLQKPRT